MTWTVIPARNTTTVRSARGQYRVISGAGEEAGAGVGAIRIPGITRMSHRNVRRRCRASNSRCSPSNSSSGVKTAGAARVESRIPGGPTGNNQVNLMLRAIVLVVALTGGLPALELEYR